MLEEKQKYWILIKVKWIVVFIILAFVIYGSHTLSQYVAGTQVQEAKTEVILDAGHGGDDPGKIGVNKVKEKDLNLQITIKVKAYLEKENVTVKLTRETDEGLEPQGAQNKKIEDMKARVKMINEVQPTIVVSIHQNSYQTEDVKGAQVFYYGHSEKGEKMAKILQEAIREVDSENHRQAKANESYYLLKRTEVPTIIVECGFLSNWEEAGKLADEDYQNQIAQAIGKGILECIGKN
ncbi:MAG: N-acetylmuramoyl-L-alanine amidase [Bariatricus sp.]|nr:N-acetylmuramoyl-L-alanine amidase [Bariatricus sp.]